LRKSAIAGAHVGGALSRVGHADTAFVQRRPHFVVNVHTRWRDPGQDAACIAWARGVFERLAPHSAGVCVNFMPGDEAGRVGDACGANFARLAQVKAKYNPENFFRLNQNIPPAEPARLAGWPKARAASSCRHPFAGCLLCLRPAAAATVAIVHKA
jgi:hypothetical protein